MTRNQYRIALSIALLGATSLLAPPLAAQQSVRFGEWTAIATASSREQNGAATISRSGSTIANSDGVLAGEEAA